MSSPSSSLHSGWRYTVSRVTLLLCFLLLLPCQIFGLNSDGALLLSFKYSILSDPLSVLGDWNYYDDTPCSWNGVMCMGFPSISTTSFNWNTSSDADFSSIPGPSASRVIGLVLPNSQLLGSISADLGLIEHLHHLDLSGNFLNGTLPETLFNASDLRILLLSNNEISGELPEIIGEIKSLQFLNLSGNALVGRVPSNLTLLPNLTMVSLANNSLSLIIRHPPPASSFANPPSRATASGKPPLRQPPPASPPSRKRGGCRERRCRKGRPGENAAAGREGGCRERICRKASPGENTGGGCQKGSPTAGGALTGGGGKQGEGIGMSNSRGGKSWEGGKREEQRK